MVVESTVTRKYAADGYASPIRILDTGLADGVRRQFDSLEATEGRERSQIGLLDRHLDQRFVWELATHPLILENIAAAIGPDILLLATHFFCKYPSAQVSDLDELSSSELGATAKYVAWHQDVTYWGLEPPCAITAWYAVDDSDVENGCMRVIPGSHLGGIREHGKADQAGNLLSINQEVPVTPEEAAAAVDLVLRAGEISLHHGMVIHGSNPNRSRRRRCGLTLRYVPPSVRQIGVNSQGRTYTALLVRGEDRFNHFDPLSPPFP